MKPNQKPPCVVVVEEYDDSRRVLKRLLEANGYSVRPAATIKEAMYIIQRDGCDLLISDVLLPDGTALDLMRTLATADAPPRAIAMTDGTSFEDKAAYAEAGFTGFVAKPILFTQLLAEVERALAH
jgi:DNA-binding NtrC family response regulator